MATQKTLYEYSVVYHDPKDNAKDKVIVPPAQVLALSPDSAKAKAFRAIPADFPEDDLEYVEVIVRPFR